MPDLWNSLRALWREHQAEVAARYKRTLPFGDYVVDRWEKAQTLGFGDGASIYDSALVIGTVSVGERTWVGPNTVLDGSGDLSIGSNCSIASGVQIYTHDTIAWATSGGTAPYEYAPTRIGDRCYIGPNSVVAKGVTIGDGAVVGAGSVVLADVPAGAKAAGSPCRVVGQVVDQGISVSPSVDDSRR